MNSIDELETTMKREGAIESLERLHRYLTWCSRQEEIEDMRMGLKWSIDAVDFQLSELKRAGGAE
jgi:hypothetical protein